LRETEMAYTTLTQKLAFSVCLDSLRLP